MIPKRVWLEWVEKFQEYYTENYFDYNPIEEGEIINEMIGSGKTIYMEQVILAILKKRSEI